MRVYLGTTYAGLRELHRSGILGPAPLSAHAVTPALRESYAEGDAEELEYVALTAAALDSLRLLAAGAGESARRVVVVADVADEAVLSRSGGASAVEVGADVPLGKVDALHVDDPAVATLVAAAVAALIAGDDSGAAVEDAQALDLMWFATQELPALLTH